MHKICRLAIPYIASLYFTVPNTAALSTLPSTTQMRLSIPAPATNVSSAYSAAGPVSYISDSLAAFTSDSAIPVETCFNNQGCRIIFDSVQSCLGTIFPDMATLSKTADDKSGTYFYCLCLNKTLNVARPYFTCSSCLQSPAGNRPGDAQHAKLVMVQHMAFCRHHDAATFDYFLSAWNKFARDYAKAYNPSTAPPVARPQTSLVHPRPSVKVGRTTALGAAKGGQSKSSVETTTSATAAAPQGTSNVPSVSWNAAEKVREFVMRRVFASAWFGVALAAVL